MLADNKNIKVNVSGITPVENGTDPRYGNWFLIDESGEFSLDRSVIATIWLVGGGCDGTAGIWHGNPISEEGKPIVNEGTGTSYSGSGGDGGNVCTVYNVKILKNQTIDSVVAQVNDKTGTSLDVGGVIYSCSQIGCISQIGGEGGNIPTAPEDKEWAEQTSAVLSKGGTNGVLTPYGYVGSSGGGGAVCNGISNAVNGVKGGEGAGNGTNHRTAGTNANNYGCGGGGGAICGWVAEGQEGGLGKQGCIIIAYTIEQSTLIVQKHYKKICNTHKTCNTDYYSNNSHKTCCGNNRHNCGNGGCGSSKGSEYIDTIHIGSKSGK